MPNGVLQEVNAKYFVLAIFSRHVRPGMAILASGDVSGQSLVAFDSVRGVLVLVSVNVGGSARAVGWELGAWGAAAGSAPRWCSGVGGGPSYAGDTVQVATGGTLDYSLPRNTVCVVEVGGATLPPSV